MSQEEKKPKQSYQLLPTADAKTPTPQTEETPNNLPPENKEAPHPTRINIPGVSFHQIIRADADATKVFLKAAMMYFFVLKYVYSDSLPNPVVAGIALLGAGATLKLVMDQREKNIQYYTQNQHRDHDLDPGNGPSTPGMNG